MRLKSSKWQRTIRKARWLLAVFLFFCWGGVGGGVVVFTFGMTSLCIKQRVEVFLLDGVLHIDLAIWTLEEGNEIIKWC